MNDSQSQPPKALDASMHDMLRMIDVASALRRERESAEAQLGLDAHKGTLRERLMATAEASGEALTEAEVDASIQQYFDQQHRYVDPAPGWARFWANVWVARTRWLLAAVLVAIVVFGSLALAHLLSKQRTPTGPPTGPPTDPPTAAATLPARSSPGKRSLPQPAHPQPAHPQPAHPEPAAKAPNIEQQFAKFDQAIAAAKGVALGKSARNRIDAIARQGTIANMSEDATALTAATTRLLELSKRLNQQYVVRIVDQPNERSGVFRNFDGKLSGHYLIVEAITEDGNSMLREVENSETGRRQRVRKWGEQVPEAIYNRVGKDKRDDGVIDQRVFARKQRGHYDEQVVFEDGRGKTLKRGRTITQW